VLRNLALMSAEFRMKFLQFSDSCMVTGLTGSVLRPQLAITHC